MASFWEKMTGMKKCPRCGQQEISLEKTVCDSCVGISPGKREIATLEIGSIARPLQDMGSRENKIRYCPNCGSSVNSGSVFCSSCGNKLLAAVSNDPFQNRPKSQDYSKSEQKELSMRWHGFYTKFLIPLNILFSLSLVDDSPIVLIDVAFLVVLFIGLYSKKIWGWKLNFVVLILSAILKSYGAGVNAEESFNEGAMGFIVGLVIYGFYAYLNWIYFMKRRQFFS